MKYLRSVGLMSSLVIGGLLAPFPSEAATTVTFQVDSGTVGTVLNVPSNAASTCTVPAGYSRCYTVTAGGTFSGTGPAGVLRQFTIKGYGGALPRVLVTDSNGNGNLDNITLTTVEFAPTVTTGWGTAAANIGTGQAAPNNFGERHSLKIVVSHKFDAVANPKTVGASARYAFALRSSGMFKGNPTGAATIAGASASGDFVKFEGVGIFSGTTQVTLRNPIPSGATCDNNNSKASPLDVNYCPLRRTLATTTLTTSSFSSNPALEQVNVSGNPYPNYACDNGNNGCTPTITLTMTATMNGPDSFVLSSSGDAAGGSCNLDPPGPPSSTPAIPCHDKKGKKGLFKLMEAYFDRQDDLDRPVFAGEGAEATAACVGAACNCQDPDTCPAGPSMGTITIIKNTNVVTGDTFHFTIDNDGPIATASIPLIGTTSQQTVVSVNAGPGYSISEDAISGWSQDPDPECDFTGGTTAITVPAGGNVTCTFRNTQVPSTGTITINKSTGDHNTYDVFYFTITGGPEPIQPGVSMNGGTSGADTFTVNTGTYNISEDPISGWALDSLSCVPGDGTSFEVLPGGGVTCTAVNSPAPILGTLRIVKQLDMNCTLGCASETFTFQVTGPSGGSPTTQTVSVTTDPTGHGETTVQVPEGTYSVTEDSHGGGWFLSGSSCTVGTPASVPVPPNGEVTCGFYNRLP